MRRKNSATIKNRILVPVSLAMVLLLCLGVLGAHLLTRRHVYDLVQHEAGEAQKLLQMKTGQDAQLLSSEMGLVERNKALQGAWRAKDREMLLNTATPLFEHMRSKYGITHFYFTGLDRICFLRVHNPERHGDKIGRFTMLQAEREARETHGVELGPLGILTLRVVRPWRMDGKLVGYIELGKEITHLTSDLKAILGMELYFIINKSYLDRDRWEEGTEMMGQTGDWDQFPSFVIIDRTMERMPAEISRYLSQLISCEGEEHLASSIEAQQGERYFMGRFLPLYDAQGSDIGDIIALFDITGAKASHRTLLIALTSGGFLVGGLLFVSLYFYLGRIENEIMQSQNALASEVESRRRIEEDIRISEKKYRNLAENLNEVVYRGDPETFQATYANSAVEQLYGYSVDEWLANPALWENSIHPDDRERVFAVVGEARRKLESAVVEYHIIRRDKTLRWVEDRVSWEKDEEGKAIAVVGIVSDITERKKAEGVIAKLNDCFLELGSDIGKNIGVITESLGIILNSTCALYNRLEGDLLRTTGEWQAPADMPREDKAKGHICFDVISASKDEPFIVRNLDSSSYAESDPNVKKYGLKTYVGCAVKLEGNVGTTVLVVANTGICNAITS